MSNLFLFYAASAFLVFWGIAHLVPTKSVIRGFGDISQDNNRLCPFVLITSALLILIGLIL